MASNSGMAIVDYAKKAEFAKTAFYANDNISEKNKTAMRRFERAYRVSPARKALFFSHIVKLLSRTPDIERDMHDRDRINDLYNAMEAAYGRNEYATIVNISKRFVRWLNDGDLPKGYKDIQQVKAKETRRKLKREDMIQWEEGVQIAAVTTSVQLKAALLAQLDGGFRPSEFIDLNYGDVTLKGDVIVAHVRDGKTGTRDVTLWRCVPYLLKWLQAHPSRKAADPLWTMEHAAKSHRKGEDGQYTSIPQDKRFQVRRYDYWSLRKAIICLGPKAGITKPLDFYALRHNSCFLDKLDNVPLDLAAKRHGHSVKYFDEVYGRLDVDDDIKRLRKHYGAVEQAEKEKLRNRVCERCKHVNTPAAQTCEQCGSSLTLAHAMQREQELDAMKSQMNAILAMLQQRAPELLVQPSSNIQQAIEIKKRRSQ